MATEINMSGKTHKGIRSRFKVTGTGKLVHKPSGKRHLMSGKSGAKVRRLSGWQAVKRPDLKSLERQFGKLR